jgi:formyl-CoA transferase/CoA:oxalate CoA-transferase
VQALTGLLSMTGHVGQPPAKIPIAALDFGSGVYGALGIVAALRVRDATGEAQHVQTSLFETALAWLSMHILTYRLGGEAPTPAGTRSAFFAPYEAYRTADGYVAVVGTGGKDAWGTFCRATGLDALRDDPSFATNSDRVANAEALRAEIEAMLMREPSAHWVRVLEDNGITCAPVRTLPDVLASEQARALGVVAELEHPVAGAVPTVRLPIRLSSSETTSSEPPPLLGADNALLRAPQQV